MEPVVASLLYQILGIRHGNTDRVDRGDWGPVLPVRTGLARPGTDGSGGRTEAFLVVDEKGGRPGEAVAVGGGDGSGGGAQEVTKKEMISTRDMTA